MIERVKSLIRRTSAISKKEFKHLFRDIRMLSLLMLFPAFLLIIFGYSVNFDVHNIKTAVYDLEKSDVSRDFVYSLINSDYFELTGYINRDLEIKKILDEKKAQCIIIIPQNFSDEFYSGNNSAFQVLVDGVDGNTAAIIQNYMNAAAQSFSNKINSRELLKRGLNGYQPVKLETRFWFNPELKSSRFLVPGLIAMILVITAVISVALSLVREKERGTMEQINVSPIKSLELIFGKTFPYLLTALFNAATILILGNILFGVEVKGSYLLLLFTTLCFLLSSTSIGILISAVADSQQIAFTMATFISLLPSFILSGFIFPIESMPVVIQWLTNITPVKYFIVILRAIILKGVGLEAIWNQILYLLIYTAVILVLANLIFIHKEKKGM
jgi:ABC-2 type transport system permease protein